MSKLGDSIKGEREIPTIQAPEEVTEALDQTQIEADEWQRQTAMDVPDIVKNDPRYKNMRFRWLHPSVISQRGWRRWKTVHTSGTPDEINTASVEFQKQTDTVVRRGDLILAYMPENLARSREAYYRRMNSAAEFVANTKQRLQDEMAARGAEATGKVTPAGIRSRKKIYGA